MKESKLKDVLRVILFPVILCRRVCLRMRRYYLAKNNPKKLASLLYKSVMGRDLDWDDPKDLNAKIQWLKFNGDIHLWARCADKFAVREYVAERGCEDVLVKLLGKWDCVEDIKWEILPEKFIMKTNNDSGGILICEDKSKLDIRDASRKMQKFLNRKFSDMYVEPHYSKIKPCIIVEELLDVKKQDVKSSSLIDYKIWCFDGVPRYIRVYHNRTGSKVQTACFDTQWNMRNDIIRYGKGFQESSIQIPKPICLDKMLEVASILSKGHPEVRMDFYSVGGKCFFGEMTFTSLGGYMDSFTYDALLEMGELTKIK